MTDPAAVTDLIHRLWWQKAKGMSWRDIALDFPGVTFQTLNKIALHGKLPADKKILRALFPREKRVRTKVQKAISKMARQTKKDVLIVRKK